MYNYQTFVRDGQLKRKCDSLKQEYQSEQKSRQMKNPSLIHSHKKRIQGFILSMIQKPHEVSLFKNSKYEPRTFDKSLNLSADAFYIHKQAQKERLAALDSKNKVENSTKTVIFRNTFSHKFRQTVSDGTGLKLRASNHSMRIRQFLDKQSLNYLPNSPSKNIDRLIKKGLWKDDKQNMSKLTALINKSLLPILHQKTYFNTVSTIYAESPNSFKAAYAQKNAGCGQDSYEQQIEGDHKGDECKTNEHLNRKQNSKQALIKCGLLKSRNYKPSTGSSSHQSAHSSACKNIR